jgi:hypothetical protein
MLEGQGIVAYSVAMHSFIVMQSYALSQLMGNMLGWVERSEQDNMREMYGSYEGKALDTNFSEGERHLYVERVMIALP